MCAHEFRNGLFALAAGGCLAFAGGAQARPAALEMVCFPSPSGDGPVWYGQSFFLGGYQYPAGGYNGGPYRPRAYSAADIYVSPPVCFVAWELYDRPARRVSRVTHRATPHHRCACPKH